MAELTVRAGEVISLVGATGSGKSRLLADIEWGAQGDTPTGRGVLLDGQVPAKHWRYAPGGQARPGGDRISHASPQNSRSNMATRAI